MALLQESLEKRFGIEFPVGAGKATWDEPLVITDQQDYVSIEYAVSKFLLDKMGFQYKFKQQKAHNQEGRIVDELVYETKEPGEADWTRTLSFFFDISAGFNRSSPPSPSQVLSTPRAYISNNADYGSPPEPSRAGHYLLVALRWLAFLPIAFLASWLMTRFFLLFKFSQLQQSNNPYVALFFMQAMNGAIIGWVGVKIAPSAKTFALLCCSLLSALVSAAYFLKFNDLLGGLSAATGLMATIIAGYVARNED